MLSRWADTGSVPDPLRRATQPQWLVIRDRVSRVVSFPRAGHPERAKTVEQIFRWYADGKSPQWIAGELNRLEVPSPGARWARKERRTDGKWMCSAIAGDRKRGVGILNNELYVGVRIWNRSQRVKEDEGRDAVERRQAGDHVRTRVPELRIVDNALWERVKARQQRQADRIGARVSAGLSKAQAQRTGRRSQYLFTGM